MYLFYCKGGVNDARGGKATAALSFLDAEQKWLSGVGSIHLAMMGKGRAEPAWTYLVAPKNAAFVSVQCCVMGQVEGGEAFFTEILLEKR